MRICIALPKVGRTTETFIAAHLERLPGEKVVLAGFPIPDSFGDGTPLLPRKLSKRMYRTVWESIHKRTPSESRQHFLIESIADFLATQKIDVVLAEYGQIGSVMTAPCRAASVPLVVHFHGADAWERSLLSHHSRSYAEMFREAASVIAVSKDMYHQLLSIGAPEETVRYSTYGVEPSRFHGASPASTLPHFVSVGRFVDKKAPILTLLAFQRVHDAMPSTRLTMIGDGPLLSSCREWVAAVDLGDAVHFPGALSSDEVAKHLQSARAFVQHSVTAESGDKEGTPLAILEAGCSGLPVVATFHAGISDVVIDGHTGLLVRERDVQGMAEGMLKLADSPELAETLGRAAADRVRQHFHIDQSIDRLNQILSAAISSNTRGIKQ